MLERAASFLTLSGALDQTLEFSFYSHKDTQRRNRFTLSCTLGDLLSLAVEEAPSTPYKEKKIAAILLKFYGSCGSKADMLLKLNKLVADLRAKHSEMGCETPDRDKEGSEVFTSNADPDHDVVAADADLSTRLKAAMAAGDAAYRWIGKPSKGGKNKRLLAPDFEDLPDKKALSQYYKVVKQPISLGQIRAKVEADGFSSEDEFLADVDLLQSNVEKAFPGKDVCGVPCCKHVNCLAEIKAGTAKRPKMTGPKPPCLCEDIAQVVSAIKAALSQTS